MIPMLIKPKALVALGFWAVSCCLAQPLSAQVVVRHTEGIVHGFLILSTLDGQQLADGEQTQSAHGDRVTTKLIFRFKDGSIHEEDAVYSQRKTFRLVSEHLVQKGPSFKQPIDMTFTTASGQATVKYTDNDGKEQVASQHMDLPPDMANGIILVLLKNLAPGDVPVKFSYLAATPKPRLVHLDISSVGDDPFVAGTATYRAIHYVVKVQIGGVAGVVAPLVGKQPPDTHVWIFKGTTPSFVQSQGPLFQGGPIWRIALTSLHEPPKGTPQPSKEKPH
jgi:hypothetical protein